MNVKVTAPVVLRKLCRSYLDCFQNRRLVSKYRKYEDTSSSGLSRAMVRATQEMVRFLVGHDIVLGSNNITSSIATKAAWNGMPIARGCAKLREACRGQQYRTRCESVLTSPCPKCRQTAQTEMRQHVRMCSWGQVGPFVFSRISTQPQLRQSRGCYVCSHVAILWVVASGCSC